MTLFRTFVVFLALAFAPMAHANCVTLSQPSVPVISYDPFSAVSPAAHFAIQINTSGCGAVIPPRVYIWFRDDLPPVPIAHELGGMTLALRYQGTDYLSSAGDPKLVPANVIAISPNMTSEVRMDISLQVTSINGIYNESRNFSMYYQVGDGNSPVQQMSINLTLSLLSSFSLTANGVGSTSLDFGTLVAGSSGSLLLTARGTERFKIEMESLYGQALRRTSTCGIALDRFDPLESIAYQAQLGAKHIDVTTPYTDLSPSAGKVFERTLPLTITVDPNFQSSQRRAGDYCDVIKLRISSF